MGVFFYRSFNRSLLWSLGALSFIACISAGFVFHISAALLDIWPGLCNEVLYRHRFFWQSFDLIILPARDVCTMAFLVAYTFLRRREEGSRWDWGLFFLFFIATASLVYSIDRGVFLVLLTLWVVLVAGICGELGRWSWLSVGAGLTTGVLFDSFLLKWDWADFIGFTFFQMPRYKELSDKLPYEINLPLFLVVLVLMAWFVYQNFVGIVLSCVQNGASGLRRYVEVHRDKMTFLLMTLLYFQGVLQRADKEHLAYSIFPFCYLMLWRLWERRGDIERFFQGWGPTLRKWVWVFMIGVVGLALARNIKVGISDYDFPIGRSDLSFLSPEERDFVERFKPLLKPGDGFFNMTSEAAWYYLLGQDCPTRYPYLGVAATEGRQREEVAELIQKKVKWVLYRDGDLSYQIDGIPNDRKFPFLNAYIQTRYRPYGTIDGYEIWVQKTSAEIPGPVSS
jgi:general stress protein CsbA